MSSGSQDEVVQLPFASAMAEYLRRVEELGAFEGVGSTVELNPRLRPVLEALHHVLAGGEVSVSIAQSGQPDVFRDLHERMERGLQQTRQLQTQPTLVATAV